MAALELTFIPPGPVADAFFRSRNMVDAIMGPQGSAKTSTLYWRHVMTALEQAPHPLTRLRQYRLVSLREDYRQLWRTNVATWLEWFPESLGEFTGSKDNPADHLIKFRHPSGDGTIVELHLQFRATGDVVDLQAFFRGLPATAFHLGEADLLPPLCLQYARGRAGRFPRRDNSCGFMGATWRGVTCDFNAPDDENWTYKEFVENLQQGWGFFRQPSGLSPEAENIHNLVPGYYEQQIDGAEDWWVRRYIRNEFGYSRDGKPVYTEYNDMQNCAAVPLLPLPHIPIVIGLDQGLNPAAIWMQEAPTGQIRWLHELRGDNVEAKDFGEMLNRINKDMFRDFELKGVPDPAGWSQAAEAAEKRSWVEIVKNATKLKMHQLPVRANQITRRLSAVRQLLKQNVNGRDPALIISPTMKHTRKGFNSGYRYRRLQVKGETYMDVPDKNLYADYHDAGQYGTIYLRGIDAIMGREDRDRAAAEQAARVSRAVEHDYDPHSF